MKFHNLRLAMLALGFAVWAADSASALDIFVPGDQPTIHDAIDVAVGGDVVVVARGTTFENIDFLGKTITAMSENGN